MNEILEVMSKYRLKHKPSMKTENITGITIISDDTMIVTSKSWQATIIIGRKVLSNYELVKA